MSIRTIEGISGIKYAEGLKVYSGMDVMSIPRRVRMSALTSIHEKLGEEKAKGHMHQPSLDKLVADMEEGNFVLSLHEDLVVATSHIRPAKSGEHNRELGGVVKLLDIPRQGRIVAQEGTRLAVHGQGAEAVEALVSLRNIEGLSFFRKVGTEIGKRKSDYVKDPETGQYADMVIFDVTAIAGAVAV